MVEDKEVFIKKLNVVYDDEVTVWYTTYIQQGFSHEEAINKMLKNKYITESSIGLPGHCRELKKKRT